MDDENNVETIEEQNVEESPQIENSPSGGQSAGFLGGLWLRLPLKFKLITLAIVAGVSLFLIIVVVLISVNPLNFLKYSDDINSTDDIQSEYTEYWNEICTDEDECSVEEKEQNEKLLASQKKFYERLDKLSKKENLTDRQKYLILSTIFYNHEIDEFSEGSAYEFDEEEGDVTHEDTLPSTDIYTEEKDTIKELVKQLKVYTIVCKYKVYNSQTGEEEEKEEILKKDDNTSYSLSFFQRFVMSFHISDEKIANFKNDCENNFQDGKFAIEKSTTNQASEESYFNYLLESDYFENHQQYESEYIEYARSMGLDVDDRKNWPEEDKTVIRKKIVENIKDIVDDYEASLEKKDSTGGSMMALLGYDLCPNGITLTGTGTMALDDYLTGVMNGEFGPTIKDVPESAKAAAIIARTFVLATTNNCQKPIRSSESVIVHRTVNTSDSMYNVYKTAIEETSGMVMIDNQGNIKGGQFVTMPAGPYLTTSGGMYTFHMQGVAGYEETNYDYTMSIADAQRIARPAGGIYLPKNTRHHWGISGYALVKMGEDGLSFEEILEQTYFVGGILHLAGKAVNPTDIKGLEINRTGTFLMRTAPVLRSDGNKFFDFTVWNVYECAWYAKERADEIMTTMGWYKTKAWINAGGSGGNGGDYCYSAGYKGYTHHWDVNDPETFKPGSIVSWAKKGHYGHVGVIEEVYDDGTFLVSDGGKGYRTVEHQHFKVYNKETIKTYTGSYGTEYFACTIDLSTGKD